MRAQKKLSIFCVTDYQCVPLHASQSLPPTFSACLLSLQTHFQYFRSKQLPNQREIIVFEAEYKMFLLLQKIARNIEKGEAGCMRALVTRIEPKAKAEAMAL